MKSSKGCQTNWHSYNRKLKPLGERFLGTLITDNSMCAHRINITERGTSRPLHGSGVMQKMYKAPPTNSQQKI